MFYGSLLIVLLLVSAILVLCQQIPASAKK